MATCSSGDFIVGKARLQGMTVPVLAKSTGLPRRTMYSRIHDPDRLLMYELRQIVKKTRMTADDLWTLVMGEEAK